MAGIGSLLLSCICLHAVHAAINPEYLKYLDPTKLQTKTPPHIQKHYALVAISRYQPRHLIVNVEVDPKLFEDKKDVFILRKIDGELHINASTGVAAVWGYHYYLKKYCKSHIEWRGQQIKVPEPIPNVNEKIVANDRFRYYQNVCTFSYSFVWWDNLEWTKHVEWMALNGINLALVPADQEAIWKKIYKEIGMTELEISDHVTGPAFLSWLRMGNVHGWGGPLLKTWHVRQKSIYNLVVDYMYNLGMIPVFPAFNGHVPKAFARIFPNVTYYNVGKWNKFSSDYCCGLFLNPKDPLFNAIGIKFLEEITGGKYLSNVYASDPFNEVQIDPWCTSLVVDTAKAIFEVIQDVDSNGVWLLQNWLFVHDPNLWPIERVKTFLTTIPTGRMLILDLQSEQWPQYDLYRMYYGQPFIWCMLHNFGGTYGLFGNTRNINTEVYAARSRNDSTMIGIGLTPEGINQNYVLYDLMLESAWRKSPVELETWAEEYSERRYGCKAANLAWSYLMRSVYDFNGLNKVRGKYVVVHRPTFKYKPWAWYKSVDLLNAFKYIVFAANCRCNNDLYKLDLVDITRQVLQYRAEQIYNNLIIDKNSNTWVFNTTINQFLDVMHDMEKITAAHYDFTGVLWFATAQDLGNDEKETEHYILNAKNQITLWGPNGEITDYAAKQWSVLFRDYYIPRWKAFLAAALEAKEKGEFFDEKSTQRVIRNTVEAKFFRMPTLPPEQFNATYLAKQLYDKWSNIPDLPDLPMNVLTTKPSTTVQLQSGDDCTIEIKTKPILETESSEEIAIDSTATTPPANIDNKNSSLFLYVIWPIRKNVSKASTSSSLN